MKNISNSKIFQPVGKCDNCKHNNQYQEWCRFKQMTVTTNRLPVLVKKCNGYEKR